MYAVILAGGSGTRFWPLSRSVRPKQLISITGGMTMIQRTVERVVPLCPERIIVVTNHLQAEETRRQLEVFSNLEIDVIPEPSAKNTAPAVALAAEYIFSNDPDGVMAVLPADHFIRNEGAFRDSLLVSEKAARDGCLVTIGIMPTRPETGYGYIESAAEAYGNSCRDVVRFVEKPSLEKALEYIENGAFFWNSGMFVWSAATIRSEICCYMPELAAEFSAVSDSFSGWNTSDSAISGIYSRIASESIDYGVMEKSSKVVVVPAEMGWSDVGSWSALPEIMDSDENGNISVNTAYHASIDSNDCLIYGNGGVVGTVGVKDLVIISTSDAFLVCDRGRAQDVKKVVESISLKGLTAYL